MVIGITGANGHVGNVLCRLLTEAGHEVKALYYSDHSALHNVPVKLIQGNILNPESLTAFAHNCDAIIHAAAIISIHGDPTGIVFKTNTEGVQNVLEAAVNAGVKKFIHVSSTHAVLERPLTEDFDETRPYKSEANFAYDYSKATGEQLALDVFKTGKIEGCIVRPSSVIGPHDFKPSEMGKALLDFYNQKVPVLPPGGYDFIDVRDLCQSIVNAIEKGRNGQVYLLSGKYATLKSYAATITEVTGKKTPQLVLPFWFLKALLPFVKLYGKITKAAPVFTIEAITALKLGHPNMNHQKAARELGHQCRPLKETLADFYNWQRKRKMIK